MKSLKKLTALSYFLSARPSLALARDRATQDVSQLVRVDSPLLPVRVGALPQAAVDDRRILAARQHHDRQLARRGAHPPHGLGPEAVRKGEVEQDRVEALGEAIDSLAERARHGELEARAVAALERALREHGVGEAVLDQQDAEPVHRRTSRSSPSPGGAAANRTSRRAASAEASARSRSSRRIGFAT